MGQILDFIFRQYDEPYAHRISMELNIDKVALLRSIKMSEKEAGKASQKTRKQL